jgi:hypothetical protein
VSHENSIAVAENVLKKATRLPDPGSCPGELIFVGPVQDPTRSVNGIAVAENLIKKAT